MKSDRLSLRRSLELWTPWLGLGLAAHGLPALAARGAWPRRLWPRLHGVGAPGGVALTFDDGPDPSGTPAVLATLASLGWTATFFLLGSQVARHPETARRIVEAGHEVAVHGFSHRNHLSRSPGALRADLERATALIGAVTGAELRWFRPPYGVLTGGTLLAARAAGLAPVLWTAWGRDWRRPAPASVVGTIAADVRDGGTILLHDSDCTSVAGSWRSTVAALPLLASHLDERGWVVRPLQAHLGAAR